MGLISLADVEAAADRIAGVCVRTPLLAAGPGADPGALRVKAESLQPTGAFKLRGATNAVAMLTDAARSRGVVTHSSGNHAQALACAAGRAGIDCTVVMPEGSVTAKVDATRRWGARVQLVPAAERAQACAAIAERSGATVVSPYEDRAVIAGAGTVGLEVLAESPDVECVLVPVGGGGLVAGVATAVKALAPHVRVVGVEPELAADATESFRLRRRVAWPVEQTTSTIADGLRLPTLGALNWTHIESLVDDMITVSEQAIVEATRYLALRVRLVAEPSGAVATAAYLGCPDPTTLGRTVAVLSGGNVDPSAYAALLRA
ncbi:MAG: threonine ammonia-lyase [Nocardioidaceae bacterium]